MSEVDAIKMKVERSVDENNKNWCIKSFINPARNMWN